MTAADGAIRAGGREVVLALGSNLGDRLANLQAGIDVLTAGQGITSTAVSAVYETSPVGGPDQPDFLNAVLLAMSPLPAPAVLDRCQAAERSAGRVRAVRWGPRTLDIDIIACDAEVSDDPALTPPPPLAIDQAAFAVTRRPSRQPAVESPPAVQKRAGDGVRRRGTSLTPGMDTAIRRVSQCSRPNHGRWRPSGRARWLDQPPFTSLRHAWTALPALLLIAIGEFAFARNLGPRLHGHPSAKPIQPMAVPRVVALAKASSTAASVIGGLALGFLVYTIPSLSKPVPGHDALASALTMLAAIVLVLAALYLERACRAPNPPEDDDDLPSSNGDRGNRYR